MKVKDVSDKFRQIESLKDLIKLSEKYDVFLIIGTGKSFYIHNAFREHVLMKSEF